MYPSSVSCEPFTHLFELLWQRVFKVVEYPEVRKLSAEALAKFPIEYSLPTALVNLSTFMQRYTVDQSPIYIFESILFDHQFSNIDEKRTRSKDVLDDIDAKLCIYILCQSVSEHGNAILYSSWIPRIVAVLITILSIPCFEENESSTLNEIQHGCIDCLSLLVYCWVMSRSGEEEDQSVGIVDVVLNFALHGFTVQETTEYNSAFDNIAPLVIEQLTVNGISSIVQDKTCLLPILPVQMRICFFNAIISTLKRIPENTKAIKVFSSMCLPRIESHIENMKKKEEEYSVMAACLQVCQE